MGLARHTQMVVNLANVLRAARNLPPDAHVPDVATAVVLSKADKLRGVPDFPAETLRDPDLRAVPLSHWFADVRATSSRLVDFLEVSGGAHLPTRGVPRPPQPHVPRGSAPRAPPRAG